MDRNVSCTSRSGIVSKITSEDIAVDIVSVSACFACRAKDLCSAFERKEKRVFVPNAGQKVQCGDKVNVVIETGIGIKAALLAYFMPVVVVVAILFFLLETGMEELYAGIISLASLAGYYSVIYLFREKLKKHFSLYIEKQTENQ
jgi:sigma-E factor negative regulatory protein RseC